MCYSKVHISLKYLFRILLFIHSTKGQIHQFHASCDRSTDWYFNGSVDRVLTADQRQDPADPMGTLRGTGTVAIVDGFLRMSGSAPRYYITSTNNVELFGDVEFTAYAKLTGRSSTAKEYAGMTMVTRTNHGDYKLNGCNAFGYYARIWFNNGKPSFQKEFYHDSQGTVYSRSQKSDSVLTENQFPLNQWVGMKFIVRTNMDKVSVTLQLYIDLTDGQNGGEWVLGLEYVDRSGWVAKTNVPAQCNMTSDAPVLRSGRNSFIRSSDVDELIWKKISIRHI